MHALYPFCISSLNAHAGCQPITYVIVTFASKLSVIWIHMSMTSSILRSLSSAGIHWVLGWTYMYKYLNLHTIRYLRSSSLHAMGKWRDNTPVVQRHCLCALLYVYGWWFAVDTAFSSFSALYIQYQVQVFRAVGLRTSQTSVYVSPHISIYVNRSEECILR